MQAPKCVLPCAWAPPAYAGEVARALGSRVGRARVQAYVRPPAGCVRRVKVDTPAAAPASSIRE